MGLSPAQLGQQTRELQGLEKVGAVQQQQTQSALDELYKEFLESEAFPEQVLDRMQGAAFGFPNLRQEVKQSPTTFGPSPFQNLATNVGAIGTGVGNLFGQLGGKTAKRHGGVVSRREGGLVPLMRRMNGGAPEPTAGELRELGFDPININNPLTRRNASLEEMYENLPEGRAKREAKAKAITDRGQAHLQNRAKRAEAAAQARLDREGKRRDPFGVGFNTTALFRMLSAAGRGDPERAQLGSIGEEAQKIAAERMATDEKFASEAALRQEALQTAGEDAEIAAMERTLARGEKDTDQDIAILDKLATNALNALKNKTSITANELKRLALYKNNAPTINAITSQALQSQNIGGMFKDGQLFALDGKTPLEGEELGKAQKVMARAFRVYAAALKQTGGNQTEAIGIAVSNFPDPTPTPKPPPATGAGTPPPPVATSKIKTSPIPKKL